MGYQQISSYLAHGLNIQLSATVTDIEYSDEGVTVTTADNRTFGWVPPLSDSVARVL
jgi:L-2-hydroxyglutarate oxidase LhgO